MNDFTIINKILKSYDGESTKITIPNGVTEIGDYAFSECTGLTSITIPNGVAEIGYYAFYGCIGLTSIIIPESVISIGNNSFHRCISLESIIVKGKTIDWAIELLKYTGMPYACKIMVEKE